MMKALFNAGFRPTWERADVVWFAKSQKFTFAPGEIVENTTDAQIVSMALDKQSQSVKQQESHIAQCAAPSSPILRSSIVKRAASTSPPLSPSYKVLKGCDNSIACSEEPCSNVDMSPCSSVSSVDVVAMQPDEVVGGSNECGPALQSDDVVVENDGCVPNVQSDGVAVGDVACGSHVSVEPHDDGYACANYVPYGGSFARYSYSSYGRFSYGPPPYY